MFSSIGYEVLKLKNFINEQDFDDELKSKFNEYLFLKNEDQFYTNRLQE